MTTLAEVRLWGRRIGAVLLEDGSEAAVFEYEPAFVRSGIQLAPLRMPLASDRFSFPGLNPETFHGLPGLLADSLPDRYGNALIDAWLAGQGRRPESFNAVERLCYVGARGMGALEFAPAQGPRAAGAADLQIEALVRLASEVLAHRERLVASLASGHQAKAMRDILSVGTSAGGARAKAVVAWNPETNQVRSGQVAAGPGFEHWLLKFDGVENNKDKDALGDPQGYGAVEFAYSQMAKDCGITMTQCRLLEEGGRRHFMTRRFDRGDGGEKRHMQSLCAMAHYDFNDPVAYSYEQAFLVVRDLGLTPEEGEQLFRRMVFNVVGRNQDDHVKNIAFLMDQAGRWELSPAFDVTYAYRPDSHWTRRHQMSLNGKRDDFTRQDLRAVAERVPLRRGLADDILDEVQTVLRRWPEYAADAGVGDEHIARIGPALRLELPAS